TSAARSGHRTRAVAALARSARAWAGAARRKWNLALMVVVAEEGRNGETRRMPKGERARSRSAVRQTDGRIAYRRANASANVSRVEQITFTANGLDQLRGFRVIAEFLPQTRDQQIDAAIKRLDGATTGRIQKLLAAEHAPRTFNEHPEQTELGVGQWHHQTIGGNQLAQHA